MLPRVLSWLVLLTAGTLTGPPATVAADPEMFRMGVAETEITPPQGYPMAGYYHERLATGVRDPLKAKAVVFLGKQSAAMVVADVTGIARDLCLQVRRQASEKTGIPEQAIVVCATHSHTAPDYSRDLYDFLKATPPADQPAPYVAQLIERMVLAIVDAHAAAQPVTVEAGWARQRTPVSFNRRFVMRDGSVRTWQRLDNPAVVRPAGPIDPAIGLLLIRSLQDQKPQGVISNFALHLDTVSGTLWSGDYPYYIEQSLREKLGPNIISVFATGPCGDINHVDPRATERNSAEFIGKALAETIHPALPELKPVKKLDFQVRTATVHLPLEEVTTQQLERARQLLPAAKAGEKVAFFDLVSSYKAVMLDQFHNKMPQPPPAEFISWGLSHAWAGVGDKLPVEVTTMTLGDEVAIVFLPGEVFVELGLAIKRGSPYRTTLIVELANCVETVYIPTRAAYAGGGYEVANSAVQAGSGEMLVEAALRLLRASATPP